MEWTQSKFGKSQKSNISYPFETNIFKLIINQGKSNISNYDRREQQTEFNLILRNIHDKRKRHTGGFMATNLINYEANTLWGTGYYKRQEELMSTQNQFKRTIRKNFPDLRVQAKVYSSAVEKHQEDKQQRKKATLMTSMIGSWQKQTITQI